MGPVGEGTRAGAAGGGGRRAKLAAMGYAMHMQGATSSSHTHGREDLGKRLVVVDVGPCPVGRHGACRDGRRRVRPVGPGAQARCQVSWLVLNGLLLLGGTQRPQAGRADRRGGSGTRRRSKAFLCSGMAAWSPMTPPWGSGSPNRPAWARSTCIGDVLALTLCAGRTSGMQLALVDFCWLLLRCVGAVGRADGYQVVAPSGVSRCGRFAGWTRPCGHERGSDAPAVQSGQMAKSCQTFAMAAGSWCLLLKSSSSAM